MAWISVPAFGTVMNFTVPNDVDASTFVVKSIRSRRDVQRQLDEWLVEQGYDPNDRYKW